MHSWDVHRFGGQGDAEADTLFASVGRALSRWEELEEDLADLFAGIVGSRQRVHDSTNPACRAYGSIPTFNMRVDMLVAAADAFFATWNQPGLHDAFQSLIRECRGFAARRNDIAHGTYRHISGVGYFIEPAYYNIRKYSADDNPSYCYSSKEIDYYEHIFGQLIEKARKLEGKVFEIRN
jgi:hypothetical protein